ncbi:MAG: 30S ribosomal protein S4 [Candidatus Magasanikbacteria bacterium RIFCSPHIGHO2_01_FULL_41_23]|uniref:Small ribosomal subunit protein uS4 n=1 Tax=Candidatus Magasanikbacteria bacterium RIFCSPLOWO2_01_FULL_40_15 TaxID=1798686 RepID=A0A1F6N2M1_9BACT|nr:MAG: 30S ribosomal protein S4 [Candidatus Magasanikbacteria bacterium RIFCSPHIGHO2_01_FULL_41_23]OGH76464.1 MAG: 30S ribosomal protein S4 [Candidatus Magasanikbacteria bacterium RIFCSPHIGHO2_12_FULL_41_16]OGH77950.1 MAG: 30S ribosomal protein S4 [Candidatus Magasanikbacteria bacterium RIFCSPLOWO2_01_FULL_40_15]
MGRYTGPRNKIARRLGVNLGLKTNPAKVARRLSQKPGVHGPNKRPKAPSSYGRQLLEKQKAKFIYGLRENQLRRYVTEATRLKGNSGTYLLQLLEMRFDNVVYRLGFAGTRAQARQMVTHGMFFLNNKKLSIPSHTVSIGDVVSIKPSKTKKKLFENIGDKLETQQLPSWLTNEPKALTGKVVSEPSKDDAEHLFDVTLIIEYFSTR